MYTEGEELARQWGVPFLETSAKTGYNCFEVFETAFSEAVRYYTPPVRLSNKQLRKKFKKIKDKGQVRDDWPWREGWKGDEMVTVCFVVVFLYIFDDVGRRHQVPEIEDACFS